MSTKFSYCRFCAKEQSAQNIIDFKTAKKERFSAMKKLLMFSEEIVDFTNKTLPETVCTACCHALNTSYEFYVQAKKAQVVLSDICALNVAVEDHLSTEPLKQEYDSLALNNFTVIDQKPADGSWSSYPWCCGMCEATVSSLRELRTHCKEMHGTCCSYRCQHCTEQKVELEEFVQHVIGHRSYLRHFCEYCNMKMDTPSHKEIHMTSYNCKFCGQTFNKDSQLLAHVKKYIPKVSNNPELFDRVISFNNMKADDDTQADTIPDNGTIDLNLIEHDCDDLDSNTLGNDMQKKSFVSVENSFESPTHTDDELLSKNESKKKVKKEKTVKKIKKEKRIKKDDIKTWSEYPLNCKYCVGKTFKTNILLRRHCITMHKTCFGRFCIDCSDDTSKTYEQFVEHVRRHRQNLKNICPYCDVTVTDEDHYKSHIKKYQCHICGFDFKVLQKFRKHEQLISLQLPASDPTLKPQISKTKRKPIKSFTRKIQENGKKRPTYYYTCKVCGKQVQNMNMHKYIHNRAPQTKNFTCEHCGKTFPTYPALQVHLNTHEEVPKNEQCMICGKSFTTTWMLKRHLLTHNLVKPYQCDHCKKCFSNKNNLRCHIVVHMDVKNHVCEYCGKRFRNRSTWRDHVRLHTGERPYGCEECGMRFACWASCRTHKQRVHGISIAKRLQTPFGRLDIDPATGLPKQINLTNDIEAWTKDMIFKGRYGNQKSDPAQI